MLDLKRRERKFQSCNTLQNALGTKGGFVSLQGKEDWKLRERVTGTGAEHAGKPQLMKDLHAELRFWGFVKKRKKEGSHFKVPSSKIKKKNCFIPNILEVWRKNGGR